MIEDFFDHKCDIYHIVKEEKSPRPGLPPTPSFHYPETPDIEGLECHFGVKSSNITIVQQQPYNSMDARIKLTLPSGTDIRLNDKIIDCDTGFEYTAEQPRNIRDHHIYVYIKRTERQKPINGNGRI